MIRIEAWQVPVYVGQDQIDWHVEEDDGTITIVTLKPSGVVRAEVLDFDDDVQDWAITQENLPVSATLKRALFKGIGR